MWPGGVEPRVHVGGPQILPLVTEIVKNSPATHLHPEEIIDTENESDADDDTGFFLTSYLILMKLNRTILCLYT